MRHRNAIYGTPLQEGGMKSGKGRLDEKYNKQLSYVLSGPLSRIICLISSALSLGILSKYGLHRFTQLYPKHRHALTLQYLSNASLWY
jgi:hypothetical protein